MLALTKKDIEEVELMAEHRCRMCRAYEERDADSRNALIAYVIECSSPQIFDTAMYEEEVEFVRKTDK